MKKALNCFLILQLEHFYLVFFTVRGLCHSYIDDGAWMLSWLRLVRHVG